MVQVKLIVAVLAVLVCVAIAQRPVARGRPGTRPGVRPPQNRPRPGSRPGVGVRPSPRDFREERPGSRVMKAGSIDPDARAFTEENKRDAGISFRNLRNPKTWDRTLENLSGTVFSCREREAEYRIANIKNGVASYYKGRSGDSYSYKVFYGASNSPRGGSGREMSGDEKIKQALDTINAQLANDRSNYVSAEYGCSMGHCDGRFGDSPVKVYCIFELKTYRRP